SDLVPDDVPVAGNAREVNTVTPEKATSQTEATSQAEATLQAEAARQASENRLWEVYFGVCVLATAVFIYLVARGDGGARWPALGLLAAMVVWYVAFGRRVVRQEVRTWRGPLFQGVLLVLFAGAVALVDAASFLLFVLCPLAYMTLRFKLAHLAVGVYAFTPAVVGLFARGPSSLFATLPLGAIALIVSLVIAISTERTERTSNERAALIRELQSTRAEVARLSREAGIAEERQRLAGDIHDTVAQGLSSVVMLLEAADAVLDRDPATAREHLRLATRTARENLAETRAIVAALTPAPLNGTPLADALRRLVDRFAGQTGTRATVSTVGENRRLETGVEVVLLRVVQEALHNVGKHARAASVEVELAVLDDAVRVQVRDD